MKNDDDISVKHQKLLKVLLEYETAIKEFDTLKQVHSQNFQNVGKKQDLKSIASDLPPYTPIKPKR